LTVTSGFEVWKPATHDSCALCCELAPMPEMVPERSEALAVSPASAPPSLLAQDARSRVPTAAIVKMLPVRLKFTEVPLWDVLAVCAGQVPTRA
jgi:hypothetical protein